MKIRSLFTLLMIICLVQVLLIPYVLAAPAKPEVIRWKGQNAFPSGISAGFAGNMVEWDRDLGSGKRFGVRHK